MRWEEISRQYDVELPEDEPILPVNVVCHIVGIQYYLLHEMLRAGIIAHARQEVKKTVRPKKAKSPKLFSLEDVKRIRYAKYLIEEKGVNVKGVKVIFEMEE